MSFNYVIKNEDGEFYNGNVYGDCRDWTKEIREGFNGAFRYTLQGAFAKIARFPYYFSGCTIEKV